MKEKLVELINNNIKENQEKEELLGQINQILEILEKDKLKMLDNNNSNLVETVFDKIITDFKNNRSYINSKEIYKGYMQFGIDGIEKYLKQVDLFLEYLKKLLLKEKENIKIVDLKSLQILKEELENNNLNLNYDLLNSLIENTNLNKEEYDLLKQYLIKREIYLKKEDLLKDTIDDIDIEENSKLVIKIAKDIFILEIDKLKTKEEKEQKLIELIDNKMYGNNKDKSNTIAILMYIIKEEIKEIEELKESMNQEEISEINDNINTLLELFVFLKELENIETEENYFNEKNKVNKILYSPQVIKDIESIDDQKTIKDIQKLLIKISTDEIPLKSKNVTDLLPNRKIKRVRSNTNNGKARIMCELLGNNTYYVSLIEAKKTNVTSKQTNDTLILRLKQYNPSTILDNIDMQFQEKLEREIIDLLNNKTKTNAKKS